MSIDYYEILGVKRSAIKAEIEKAYKKLMMSHHPDKHGQQDDPISRLLNDAYEVLGDEKKRAQYDSAHTSNDAKNDIQTDKNPDTESKEVAKHRTSDSIKREPCHVCKSMKEVKMDEVQGHFRLPGLNVKTTCKHCDGSGLEPIPVELPPGRKHCHVCKGMRKVKMSEVQGHFRLSGLNIKTTCGHCRGKGLEPK